jgi:hypothetical protein
MQHLRSQAQAETAGSSGAPAWEAAQENSVASAEAEVAVPVAYPDEWESPTSEFEAFVGDIVKHRIGKYEQPEHPNRITHEEAASIYRKIRREIIAKEHEAYAERQRQKLFKPILVSVNPLPCLPVDLVSMYCLPRDRVFMQVSCFVCDFRRSPALIAIEAGAPCEGVRSRDGQTNTPCEGSMKLHGRDC